MLQTIDTQKIKQDFPIFSNNPGLVYLDSTATSLKPKIVIDKIREYYEQYTANVYRGIYQSSERATAEFEQSRGLSAKYINSDQKASIIFTRNASEALNLVCSTIGQEIVKEGDEIVTTIMEHHSNFVPWQQLAKRKNATLKVLDVDEEGYLQIVNKVDQSVDFELLRQFVSERTAIFALTYVSNTLGTINPVAEIIKAAKKLNPNIITVVDAAQAAPHTKIDVKTIGCDFLALSAHKMLGPTGIGILWGRYELLEKMPPYQFGGEMISEVLVDHSTFKETPHKFEAGTPNIADGIAFQSAISYLENIGLNAVRAHEKLITTYAIKRLEEEFGNRIHIFGPKNVEHRGGIVTFTLEGCHPHDMAQILDEDHIAIRAGNHCTMPLHRRLEAVATARASFYIYNDEEDVEKLVKGLKRVEKVLK